MDAMRELTLQEKLLWIFRIAVAAEFIGHGAFGIITKAAWVPYFGVVGISEPLAYKLMPLIGMVDVTLGILTLLCPLRAVLLYMSVWGLWTASLRPLSGDSIWEAVERAGNYGVPFAFLLLSGWGKSFKDWFSPIELHALRPAKMTKIALVLRLATGLLLFGHGALIVLAHKQALAGQLAVLGAGSASLQPSLVAQYAGGLEMLLAALVCVRPLPRLLLFVALWKIAVELIYPLTGAPVWEFIERGGSYVAPLALYLIESSRLVPATIQSRGRSKPVTPAVRRITPLPVGR